MIGPWFYARDRFNNPEHDDKIGSIVDDAEDFVLAEVCGDAPNPVANGRLMAAAPELLDSLKTAFATLTEHQTGDLYEACVQKVYAVLKKVEAIQ